MKRVFFALAVALLLPSLLAAQAKPAAASQQKLILEYVDGADLTVTTPDGMALQLNVGIFEGESIPVGSTIATGAATSAELKLSPNGTIIKLAKGTSFRIESLAGGQVQMNAFALVAGKLRAVAAKGTGQGYQIATQSTVCGVRGTDFAFSYTPGTEAQLFVQKGEVAFQKLAADGSVLAEIPVMAGMFADAMASVFEAAAFTPEQLGSFFEGMKFDKVDETSVPGNVDAAAPTEPVAETTPPAETGSGPTGQAASLPSSVPESGGVSAEPAASTEPTAESAAAEAGSGVMAWLRDVLGMEIGSVTINGITYSKAILQPTFAFGDLKASLYLPVIYSSDLFNPDDWYKPEGESEWDFGSPHWQAGEYLPAILDTARDLALKIRYIEYGTPLADPFYLKVGNLRTMTLGHGLIVSGYANDADFPAVRKVGLNMGFDAPVGGMELLVNDLTNPQVIGTRLYLKLIGSLALGVSAVADLSPGSMLNTIASPTESALYGDPIFIGAGLDLDLPIVVSDFLTLRGYADAAAMVPYVRNDFGSVTAGLKYELIYDSAGSIKNWGAALGFMGNVLFINYKLEGRYFTGAFKPAFFNGQYERARSGYVVEYASYLSDPSSYAELPTIMGIYGEGGFKILDDKLALTLGYMWPWSFEAGLDVEQQLAVSSNDIFKAVLAVKKGLIPIVDLAGAVTYERRNFANTIFHPSSEFDLFDENSSLSGEISMPIPKAPNIDIAFIFSLVPMRDPVTGAIVYRDGSTVRPKMAPSISLETRIHF